MEDGFWGTGDRLKGGVAMTLRRPYRGTNNAVVP